MSCSVAFVLTSSIQLQTQIQSLETFTAAWFREFMRDLYLKYLLRFARGDFINTSGEEQPISQFHEQCLDTTIPHYKPRPDM